MNFVWSPGGLIIGAIAYGLLLWAGIVISWNRQDDAIERAKSAHRHAAATGKEVPDDVSRKRGVFWRTLIGWLIIWYAAVNGVVYGLTYAANTTPNPGVADVATAFGLKSGVEYPLVLGNHSMLSREAHFGILPIKESTLTIDFINSDGRTWLLEIPINESLNIVQATDRAPSVELEFYDGTIYSEYGDARYIPKFGECVPAVKTLLVTCDRDATYTLTIDDQLRKTGLVPLLKGNVYGATIVLPPDKYAEITGRAANS